MARFCEGTLGNGNRLDALGISGAAFRRLGWCYIFMIMSNGPWAFFTALGPLFHPEQIDRQEMGQALDVVIVLSFGAAILWLLATSIRRPGKHEAAPPRGSDHIALFAFLFLCGLLLVNQLLVNVYVLRQHAGDASFVSKYLGWGWFALALHSAPVIFVNEHLPAWAARFLPYTILRVQAALELPFVITAYLAITAFLSPMLSRALWRSVLLPLALLSFTATFCLVEMRLFNPWTLSDLHWRWASCSVMFLFWGLSRMLSSPAPLPSPSGSPARLLLFLCGGGALAMSVLLMYMVALLYNLRYLTAVMPWLLGCAGVVLIAAPLTGPAQQTKEGPALKGVFGLLYMFTAAFFVPSLAIRYAGHRPSAEAVGPLIVFLALLFAVIRLTRQQPAGAKLRGLGVFIAAGSLAASADAFGWLGLSRLPVVEEVPEFGMLRAAVLFMVVGGAAATVLDRLVQGQPESGPGETS